MRADLIRVYKTVHTWTGITTGLILFVAFFAGALTMFKAPLLRWAEPPLLAEPAQLLSADDLIARTIAQHPHVAKGFTVHLDGPLRLSWQKDRRDTQPFVAQAGADGTVPLRQDTSSGLDWFVDFLHRTGGLPLDLEDGTMVTGLAAALYAVALVSGLIVLLPSLVKDLFALRLGKNVKRLWLDAHNLVGLFSLPFHLVIAVTSVVFGWHDLFYAGLDQTVYHGKMAAVMRASSPPPPFGGDKSPAPMLDVAQILARSRAEAPGLSVTALEWRDHGSRAATVRVVGHDPRFLVRGHGFLTLGATDGAVINTEYLPGRQNGWSATVSAFFALHFGTFGGEPVRWFYFVLGLGGAFLFYSGNLLWIESRRRPRRGQPQPPEQARSARIMAAASVGVALGCVAGLPAAIVANRWLQGVFVDVNDWTRGAYYLVFVAFVAISLRRGAARAAPPLLGMAAFCTLLIPLTSALRWHSAAPMVDAVALTGAAVLAVLAGKAARRVRHGPADSVWSLTPGRD